MPETKQQDKSGPIARGKRLKSLRMMAGLSRKAVDESYQISSGTLQGWEDGRYGGLTQKGARRILQSMQREGVQCSLEWLIHGTGLGPQLSAPMDATLNPSAGDDAAMVDELLYFRNRNQDIMDHIINDKLMLPCYEVGDVVAGRRRYNWREVQGLLGKNCLIQLNTGEIYLKHLKEVTLDEILHFTMLEDSKMLSIAFDKIRCIAPVTWHRRRDPA